MPARFEPQKPANLLAVGDRFTFEPLPELGELLVIDVTPDQYVFLSGKAGDGRISKGSLFLRHVPQRIVEVYQDFEVGDKVILRAESGYSDQGPRNPAPDVVGEILEITWSGVRVMWPGGQNYYGSDLHVEVSDGGLHLALCKPTPSVEIPELVEEDICATLKIKGDMLFGSDLELFVRDTRTDKIIPAGCLIPGTKSSPFKLENGVCHPDGLAVEVACPPSDSFRGLVQNLEKVLAEVKEKFFPESYYVWDDRCVVKAADVLDVDIHKQNNPEWFISGCAPELSALNQLTVYKAGRHYRSDIGTSRKGRSKDVYCAGFHLHLGFTKWENTPATRIDAACLVERVAGTVVQRGLINSVRSQFYGGRGVFRMKPYGVEDRTYGADVYLKNKDHLEKLAAEYKKLIMEALNA